MAKKGAVQQLQAELNSDEDFEKFMERDGLLVLDVYTEWCGPCVGMIGSLKKIKLELGGDNLQLAICKADTVNYMVRFRNKSEPTWLFASHNKVVNCLFGTNVPELMQTIADELILEEKYNAGEIKRTFFEWTELTPIEQERENKRKARDEEINKKEHEAELKRRAEYLTFVTNEIIERLPDAGVTLVMPNYAKERDIQKKLGEPADKCGLNMKDRRIITIKESDLEVILFDLTNPLHDEIYKKLFTEEILAVYWKTHDTELRDVLDLMNSFVDVLCNPQPLINEDGQPDPELKMPPVFKPWQFDVPQEIYKQILADMGISEEEEKKENTESTTEETAVPTEAAALVPISEGGAGSRPPSAEADATLADSKNEKTTADAATGAPDSPKQNDENPQSGNTTAEHSENTTPRTNETPRTDASGENTHRSDDSTDKTPRSATTDATARSDGSADKTHRSQETEGTTATAETKTEPQESEKSPEKSPANSKPATPTTADAAVLADKPDQEKATEVVKTESKTSVVTFQKVNDDGLVTLNVPSIYAPANKRGNASLIYLYFRHLTDHFLPPDPVPEPPHVAVIFDAIKRKDVCQLMATMNEGDILAYGYFSGVDPDTAHLLAKTNELYAERKFNIEDKMVLKVAKKTSNVLLNFVGLGPSFVSFSTVEGKEECKKFFPCGYNEEDEDETSSVDSSSSKKKRKKKKKKEGSGSDIGISDAIAEETEEGGDEGENLPDDDEGVVAAEPGQDAAPPGEAVPAGDGAPTTQPPETTEAAPAAAAEPTPAVAPEATPTAAPEPEPAVAAEPVPAPPAESQAPEPAAETKQAE